MASYIPQFVLSLRNSDTHDSAKDSAEVKLRPMLEHIAVFSPSLLDLAEELNDALRKQILCFTSSVSYSDDDKLNSIGLSIGVDSFSRQFGRSKRKKRHGQSRKEDRNTNIVLTDRGGMILQEIEQNVFLSCKVEIPLSRDADVVTRQLSLLIGQASKYFSMLHKPVAVILKDQSTSDVETKLALFWGGFMENFNESQSSHPFPFKWPNEALGHRGFLGLLPVSYKKSSINLNSNCKTEIELIARDKHAASAVLIASVDRTSPKNYGLIYSQSDIIEEDSLHCLYNWLELFDQQNKLDTTHLISQDTKTLFDLPIVHHELHERGSTGPNGAPLIENLLMMPPAYRASLFDTRSVKSSSIQSILSPMNVTNTLVILPFNNTVAGVRSLGTMTNKWLTSPPKLGVPSMPSMPGMGVPSLKMPSYLNPFGSTSSNAEVPVAGDDSDHSSSDIQDTPASPLGTFLIGLVANIHDPSTIYHKLVYLKNKHEGKYMEYQLVLYERDNIIVALLYPPSYAALNSAEFYTELASTGLEPLVEEILTNGGLGTAAGSLSSIRSLNAIGISGTSEPQDFFFIIVDPREKSVRSSFPYLHHQSSTHPNTTIYFLHDILADVFLVQGGSEFFNLDNSTIREYFHKFNGGKSTDWMFYYIQYNDKFIIIIKNQNPKTRKTAKPVALPPSNAGIISNITEGIYDYASLGFLDNLGEDVKSWLEGFSVNGET